MKSETLVIVALAGVALYFALKPRTVMAQQPLPQQPAQGGGVDWGDVALGAATGVLDWAFGSDRDETARDPVYSI